MRITISDEFTPSPQDMIEEFWFSDAERQAEILYCLALNYKNNLPEFCMQMFSVGEEFDEDERRAVLDCFEKMIDQIER